MDTGGEAEVGAVYLRTVHMHFAKVVLKKNRRGRRESSADFVHLSLFFAR